MYIISKRCKIEDIKSPLMPLISFNFKRKRNFVRIENAFTLKSFKFFIKFYNIALDPDPTVFKSTTLILTVFSV